MLGLVLGKRCRGIPFSLLLLWAEQKAPPLLLRCIRFYTANTTKSCVLNHRCAEDTSVLLQNLLSKFQPPTPTHLNYYFAYTTIQPLPAHNQLPVTPWSFFLLGKPPFSKYAQGSVRCVSVPCLAGVGLSGRASSSDRCLGPRQFSVRYPVGNRAVWGGGHLWPTRRRNENCVPSGRGSHSQGGIPMATVGTVIDCALLGQTARSSWLLGAGLPAAMEKTRCKRRFYLGAPRIIWLPVLQSMYRR